MNIKMNLEFINESKELLDGIERLVRLIEDLEIENIEIFQDNEITKVKIAYKNLDNATLYATCQIHKDILEHYFDVDFGWSTGNIYDNVGDFGLTPDQVLYLKYGNNQRLYTVEKEGIFDEVGITFSETELKEWFKEFWDNTYAWENDGFNCWLSTTVNNGYLKRYDLFDVKKDEEYLNELFNQNNN